MAYPDKINNLVDVTGDQTLAAGGHAARHNDVNEALEELADVLTVPSANYIYLQPADINDGFFVTGNGSLVTSLGLGGTSGGLGAFVTEYNRADGSLRYKWGLRDTVSEKVRWTVDGALLLGTTAPGSASTGDLVVNGGVFLGGSAAANELDDYEEGTWTPELTYETPGDLSVTYISRPASYVKVGSLVFIRGEVVLSAFTKGTATGDIRIDGLPFTSDSRSFISWGAQFTPLTATDGHYPAALVGLNTAYVSWINVTSNGNYGSTDPDGNSRIFVSGCYSTNS